MLQRMRQLRNAVEHDRAQPPSLDDCEDYAEVTWWFLRGTSPLLAPVDMLEYGGPANGTIGYDYNPLKITVHMELAPDLASENPHDECSKIAVASLDRQEQLIWADDEEAVKMYIIDGEISSPESALPLLRNAFRQLQ